VRIRIHRGAAEIGGNCIEVQAAGKSILLDLGAPLMGEAFGRDALPSIPGLTDGSNHDLLGIVISHPHADHYGLAEHAHPSLPICIGREADKLLRAAKSFGPFGAAFTNVRHYGSRRPFMVGPFRLTPYLADHSAFDSYSFLIEADGKRVFYSGDLRGHGWKKWAFENLLNDPPISVDAMVLEGTTLGRDQDEAQVHESDLVDTLTDQIRDTSGLVLAAFSGQNIDRLVSFFKAALKSRRTFVVDLYVAHILRAIGRQTLPDPTSDALRVYLPHRMKMKIVRDGTFDLVEPFKHRRIYPHELRRRAGRLVMTFRPTMAEDLQRARCLEGAKVIYSMWPGYLDRGNVDLRDWCRDNGVGFDIVHTSGHASAHDLKRLVSAIRPKALVPIHTLAPHRFHDLGAHVVTARNNQLLNIA